MKTLVLYYSYSGNTKHIAEKIAADESADIVEVKDVRRPGKLKAYTAGIFAAIRGKTWLIQALTTDFTAYERLILLFPIWADNPPPAFNTVLAQLPQGKTVAFKMVSMSGRSDCQARLEAALAAKDCTLESFEDIKS